MLPHKNKQDNKVYYNLYNKEEWVEVDKNLLLDYHLLKVQLMPLKLNQIGSTRWEHASQLR